MVLTDKQKAIIENDFDEIGWNAYKMEEASEFECFGMAVYNIGWSRKIFLIAANV